MSVVSEVQDLATAVGLEIKAVRTEITPIQFLTQDDYDALVGGPVTGVAYFIIPE